MVNWNKIKLDLKRNKEGIFIGVLVGLGLTIYLSATGADLSFAGLGRTGIIDHIVGTSLSLKQLLLTKVGTALIIICATIGYIIDKIFKPGR